MQDLNFLHSSFEVKEGPVEKNIEHIDLEMKKEEVFYGMVGTSGPMLKLFEEIKKTTSSCFPILILGSDGVGKKLAAKAIHKISKSTRPLVLINCQTLPQEFFEKEVFKRLNRASKVDFFFQRIEEMDLQLQEKLLMVVSKEHPGSLQWIASAAPKLLKEKVEQGLFREELYKYFNNFTIKVPDLKERKEDISLLIHFFLKRYLHIDGPSISKISEEVLSSLICYDWPGNVRELDNLMERLVVLVGNEPIRQEFLPQKFRAKLQELPRISFSLPPEGINLKKTLSYLEDSLIQQALKKTHGNKNKASQLLHINRTTLIEKIKKKGLSKD